MNEGSHQLDRQRRQRRRKRRRYRVPKAALGIDYERYNPEGPRTSSNPDTMDMPRSGGGSRVTAVLVFIAIILLLAGIFLLLLAESRPSFF